MTASQGIIPSQVLVELAAILAREKLSLALLGSLPGSLGVSLSGSQAAKSLVGQRLCSAGYLLGAPVVGAGPVVSIVSHTPKYSSPGR